MYEPLNFIEMKIQVENLGTIQKGEIDLDKNLVIFAGPNNSGKSYMTYLIYGLYRITTYHPNNMLFKEYRKRVKNILEKSQIWKGILNETGISMNRRQFFNENVQIYVAVLKALLMESLSEVFASRDLSPKIDLFRLKPLKEIISTVQKERKAIEKIGNITYAIKIKDDLLEITSPEHSNENIEMLKRFVTGFLIRINKANVYFFPAERTAINMVAKEIVKKKSVDRDEIARRMLVGEEIEEIINEIKENFVPRYPLAISDYLYSVYDLEETVKQPETKYADLANETENILKGKVSVSQFGSIEFTPENSIQKLPLHLSSSLVKSLSTLVFYFRHLAKDRDIIIIDEPELNLHPDNQSKVARLLAKAANRGFQIIMSTHSDYIIREFNNLIMLHKQSETTAELKKRYSYQEDEILDFKQVGVYLFEQSGVKEVKSTEKGFSIKTIDRVITEQNIASQDIYNSLFEEGEEDEPA